MANVDDIFQIIDFIDVETIMINELATYSNPLKMIGIVKKLKEKFNCKLIISIHDYFAICPSLFLLNDSLQYCNIPEKDECTRCIKNNKAEFIPIRYTNIDNWREKWGEILEGSEEILCFSNSSKEILQKAYTFLEDCKFNITPHTVGHLKRIAATNNSSGILNIGILGVLTLHKGSEIVKEMLDLIDFKKLRVKITLIGQTQVDIKSNHLVITGEYSRNDLPEIVKQQQIDMFFLPSICPETFSFTTEEIIKMGFPIAVFNLGAPAEKVVKYDKGLVIRRFNAEYALQSIMTFWRNHANN